jgi:hypothetical protein
MNPRHPWFVAGFLAGSAIGSALALLLAPASGQELIAAVQRHLEEATRQAREAGLRAEADVLTRYKAIRDAALAGPVGATSGLSITPAPAAQGAPSA